jgi:enoyl-CoA hydratase
MDIDTDVTDGIATLTLDDGKANAMDLGFFAALDEALDGCAGAQAVVVRGREGMFSAGLNTKMLAGLDTDGLTELLVVFGRTMLRVWEEPRPVVAAATGHAIAGGTVLAMVCDHAVAAGGDFRWGLTETTIGFPMPKWVVAIARGNVRRDRLDDLVLPGRLLDAAEAVEVGFADEIVPPMQVVDRAMHRAGELARLPRNVYAYTKTVLRGPAISAARHDLESDVAAAMAAR